MFSSLVPVFLEGLWHNLIVHLRWWSKCYHKLLLQTCHKTHCNSTLSGRAGRKVYAIPLVPVQDPEPVQVEGGGNGEGKCKDVAEWTYPVPLPEPGPPRLEP